MNWFRTITNALHYEPEVWAAYLRGQQPQTVFNGIKGKPRYRGLPLRLAAYGRGLLRLVRLRTKTGDKKSADIFVFAQTANQANSLSPTLSHLNEWGVSIHRVTGHGAASTSGEFAKNDCEWMTLSTVDVVRVAVLTILRSPIIWCQLADKDRRLRQWHFDAFLRCHIYLVFFEKALAATNPRLILISNDHNAPQRCLLSLARVKGIKTAYMQHASVSRIFPALIFDYSLLDGQVAKDTYMDCELNKPASAPMPDQRHIFLTGQKKPVRRVPGMSHSTVGLAINTLDSVQDVMKVVTVVAEAGYVLRLRWHPAMNMARVDQIRHACSPIQSVGLSDPLVETVGDFLTQVGVLVAANSSIHLEAAVASVMPIYFEISPASTWDYYGYVRNGVSAEAKSTEELPELIGNVLSGYRKLNSAVVQAYSATFDTEWEGREGELAAGIIKDLLNGAEPSECWGYAGLMRSIQSQRVAAVASHI